jgi:hypothetical protein
MKKDSSKPDPKTGPSSGASPALKDASKFEKYAATQAAADGIEGDVKKPRKTEAEKLAAQMADAK